MAALTTPTSTAVIPSSAANISIGTAGGNVVIGCPVYYDTATTPPTVKAANADSTGSALIATAAGLALNSAAVGQKVMINTGDTAHIHGYTAAEIAPGDFVYLDDTAGNVTITKADLTAGDYITFIGQINNPETTMNLAPKAPVLSA